MRSDLFAQENHELQVEQRFVRQNPQVLRVRLGGDVLATKGSMVAFQGRITFTHEGAGGVGTFLEEVLTDEDLPLMRVSGEGEVFFAHEAAFVHLLELTGDALSINGTSLLAFDASLGWDIQRVQGAGTMAGGLYNAVVSGTGTAALCTIGQPVVLDCSQQPTYVDVQAAVGWSANLAPQVVSSMNLRSVLRGGSGEAFQYAFHGPGFVVVQPSELSGRTQQSQSAAQTGGGFLGDLLR